MIFFGRTFAIRNCKYKYHLGPSMHSEFHLIVIYGVSCLKYTAGLYQDHTGWRLTL